MRVHTRHPARACGAIAAALGLVLLGADRAAGQANTPAKQAAAAVMSGELGLVGEHPPTDCNLWAVTYDDAVLGRVEGKATVDWKHRTAQVVLTDPVGLTQTVFNSVSVTPPDVGADAVFVFKGDSPSEGKIPWPDTTGLPNTNTSTAGATTNISGSFGRSKVTQLYRDFADDVVKVSLSDDGDGDLVGHWTYRSDPVTERMRDGGGRIGAFTLVKDDQAGNFVGNQTDFEEWLQLRPEILDAVVLDDGPTGYPDPTPPPKAERGMGTVGPKYNFYRSLMIVGRNLPLWKEKGKRAVNLGDFKTERTDITYRFFASSDDPSGQGTSTAAQTTPLAADPRDFYEEGWQKITNGMDPKAAARVRTLDAVIVQVQFNRGVVPGVTDFTWGGAKAVWRLNFNDFSADARIVRRLSDAQQTSGGPGQPKASGAAEVWEQTQDVFLPEPITVEVGTAFPLPIDSLDVFVSLNKGLDPTPLKAVRVGGDGSRIYRTGPVAVYDPDRPFNPAQGRATPVHQGDRLTFVVEQKKGYFTNGAVTSPSIYNDPSELGTTWHHMLSICAKIAGKPDLDWSHNAGSQVQAFTDYFVFSWEKEGSVVNSGIPGVNGWPPPAPQYTGHTSNCNLTMGQHAAMLMLRAKFLEMMRRQKANLDAFAAPGTDATDQSKRDDALLGWGDVVAQAIRRNPGCFFGGLSAGMLNGAPCTVADAVNDFKLNEVFHEDQAQIRAWKLQAIRTALTQYSKQVQASIDFAAAIKNTEREKLLKLTGKSFEPVAARLLPDLMKVDPETQQWVPDQLARGYVLSIADKEQELEEMGAASNIDTQLAVGVISAAAAAPVMVSESAVASFITWWANGVIWDIQTAHEIIDLLKAKDELAFAYGSAMVLGQLRYDEAKLQDTEWWKLTASIVGQYALANLQGIDALSKASREMAVFRGALIMSETSGLQALRELSAREMADVQAFVMEAKATQNAGQVLTEGQAVALATWDQFGSQTKLSEDILSRIWKDGQSLKRTLEEVESVPNPEIVATRDRLVAEIATLKEIKGYGAFPALVQGDLDGYLKAREMQLNVTRAILDMSITRPADFEKVSAAEINWMLRTQKDVNVARMQLILMDHQSTWSLVKEDFEAGKISPSDMWQFITWRKQAVDAMLADVMSEVESEVSAELGTKVRIRAKALGSTNLTSDYDLTVSGPGAERVIGRFNERFRSAYGGLESGHVFDTNVYTDPTYNLFKVRELSGQGLELGSAAMDTVRQFVYDEMAIRKYMPDPVWAKHKELMLSAAGSDGEAMMRYSLEQAEQANAAAMKVIGDEMTALASGGADAKSANTLLRAQNNAYAGVLTQIEGWKTEFRRLEQLSTGGSKLAEPTADFLKDYPNYKARIDRLRLLTRANDAEGTKALLDTMRQEIMAQMRDTQGIALYFASEAYQSEGTIWHVVDEIQGSGRPVNYDYLSAPIWKSSNPPKYTAPPAANEFRPDSLAYINSFNENRGNMFKEFVHLGVYGGHATAPGEKLAAKSAKYFIRQLDAARQAGVDLSKTFENDLGLIELTTKIDKARSDLPKVASLLADPSVNMTGLDYVQAISDASDKLSVLCVEQQEFRDLARYLSPQFAELRELEKGASVEPAVATRMAPPVTQH